MVWSAVAGDSWAVMMAVPRLPMSPQQQQARFAHSIRWVRKWSGLMSVTVAVAGEPPVVAPDHAWHVEPVAGAAVKGSDQCHVDGWRLGPWCPGRGSGAGRSGSWPRLMSTACRPGNLPKPGHRVNPSATPGADVWGSFPVRAQSPGPSGRS